VQILVTATLNSDPKVRAAAFVIIDPIPLPHSGPHILMGDVYSVQTGMIADASINIWVDLGRGGYSYWFANGPVQSDASGHFEAPNLPDSQVQVRAGKDGYVQPCAVNVEVHGDLSIQVEEQPITALDGFDPPRPQSAIAPFLTGEIYETTAGGRQPVTGAMIQVVTFMDMTIATTVSDRGGKYFLCNLGPLVALYIVKPGYATESLTQIDASTSRVLDIELKRSPSGP